MHRYAAIMIFTATAFGQSVRFDSFTYTTNAGCVSGKQCPLLAIPGASIAVCNDSACVSKATTYTSSTGVMACGSLAQLTPLAGGPCTAVSDSQGNFGFWVSPGTYWYTIAVPGVPTPYGPYPVTTPGPAGGYTWDANYSSLASACAAAAPATLVVTKTWNGLNTQSFTACQMWFMGGKLQPSSGKTVTLNCPIAEPLQIFDTSPGGVVAFVGCSQPSPVQWWGAKCDGASDDSAGLQAALNFSASGSPVSYPSGGVSCNHSVPLMVTAGATVKGFGRLNAASLPNSIDKYTGSAPGSWIVAPYVVNTSGTSVTRLAGPAFTGLTGTFTINNTAFTVSSVESANSLTLTASAGSQSYAAAYSATALFTFNLFIDGIGFQPGTASHNSAPCALCITHLSQFDFRNLNIGGTGGFDKGIRAIGLYAGLGNGGISGNTTSYNNTADVSIEADATASNGNGIHIHDNFFFQADSCILTSQLYDSEINSNVCESSNRFVNLTDDQSTYHMQVSSNQVELENVSIHDNLADSLASNNPAYSTPKCIVVNNTNPGVSFFVDGVHLDNMTCINTGGAHQVEFTMAATWGLMKNFTSANSHYWKQTTAAFGSNSSGVVITSTNDDSQNAAGSALPVFDGSGTFGATYLAMVKDNQTSGAVQWSVDSGGNMIANGSLRGPYILTDPVTTIAAGGSTVQVGMRNAGRATRYNCVVESTESGSNTGSSPTCYYYTDSGSAVKDWTMQRATGNRAFSQPVGAPYFAVNVGSTLASASTIAPVAGVTHFSGTATIHNIMPPSAITPGGNVFTGCLTLVPDGAWTTATDGNIANVITATVNIPVLACYDGSAAKWYMK